MTGKKTVLASAMEDLTPSPGAPRVRREDIRALWPELTALSDCPQDPVHHAEGDAGTHTGVNYRQLKQAASETMKVFETGSEALPPPPSPSAA